jgi:[ribosomal protein S5]-alanine N-acetyltransferase
MVSTQRLNIIPLSYDQLLMYLHANDLLEEQLGLTKTGRTISEDVKEMVETFTLPKIKEVSEDHFIFYTFWIVVEKSSGIIVAELGFKGPPDENGAVEIGYGTMPGYEGKGFMTEAVAYIFEWASQRKDITTVLASIDKNNIASIRIAEKNKFELYDQKEEMLWWRKYTSSRPSPEGEGAPFTALAFRG